VLWLETIIAVLVKELFSLMERLPLERLMKISFVPPWIGGHLRNVIMGHAAGIMLLSLIW
jgi:hypothetical protein